MRGRIQTALRMSAAWSVKKYDRYGGSENRLTLVTRIFFAAESTSSLTAPRRREPDRGRDRDQDPKTHGPPCHLHRLVAADDRWGAARSGDSRSRLAQRRRSDECRGH